MDSALYTRHSSNTWAGLPSYTPSATSVAPASPSPIGRRPRAYAFRVAPQPALPVRNATQTIAGGVMGLGQTRKGGYKFDPFADEPVEIPQRTTASPPSWETLQTLASLSAPPPAPRLAHASLPHQTQQQQRKPYNHQLAQQAKRSSTAPGYGKRLPAGVEPLYAPSPKAYSASAKGGNVYSPRLPQGKRLAYELVEYDDADYDVPPPPSPSPPPPYTPTSQSTVLNPRSPPFTPRYPAPCYAPRSIAPPAPPAQRTARTPSPPAQPAQRLTRTPSPPAQRLTRTPSPPAASPSITKTKTPTHGDKDAKSRLVAGILLNRVHVPKVRRRPVVLGEKRAYVGSGLRFEVMCDA